MAVQAKQQIPVWALVVGGLVVVVALIWQGLTSAGVPDPFATGLAPSAVIMNTSLIVFREGLEAVLILAAITASFVGEQRKHNKPIIWGSLVAFGASIATWFAVVAIIDAIDAPLLDIQAATGLLAIVVLLVIMNWFLHNVYWTGWIGMHNQKKREILAGTRTGVSAAVGLMLLGFSAVYREGFEIVLFLQNVRLGVGVEPVLYGVLIGLGFTGIVGSLTFATQYKLPYKRLLIVTGLLLAMVLVVMVGEQVQEMQQAHWIATTTVPLAIPGWMGMWFAMFPNVEGLVAQAAALLFVVGSYVVARYLKVWRLQPAAA
jgi:high-affinity iron transporter